MRYILLAFLAYLLIMNLAAFIAYGIDKSRAQNARRRTPEKTLIGLAGAGGALGALIGMFVFHHKTRKIKFVILNPFFSIIWLTVIIILSYILLTT